VRNHIRELAWQFAGAIALLSIAVAAISAFDPGEAELLTAACVVVAVAWWAHAWRRLWLDERGKGRLA
jgi:hypothetical protein